MTEADSPRAPIRIVSLAGVRALFAAHRRFLVTTHVRPDADAIGSEIALAVFLRGAGKDVRIVNDSPLPANLAFLDPYRWVERYESARHAKLVAESEVIVFLDMNDGERAGALAGDARTAPACKIVIDHHLDPMPFADAYLVDAGVSATAEILYELIAGCEGALDPHAALGLYAGIMMDTGSFRFERTTPRVHRIAARLLEAGVDPTETYRRINDEYPIGRTRLLGSVLSSIRTACGGRATVLTVSRDDLARTGTTVEDTENLVQFGLSIQGVAATVLLTEVEEGVKLSFRSRGSVSVQPLARALGGGGHACAAGATLRGATIEEAARRILPLLCGLLERETPGPRTTGAGG